MLALLLSSQASLAALNLKRVGLEMNLEKTAVRTFAEGFQFVGWFFVREEMFQLK